MRQKMYLVLLLVILSGSLRAQSKQKEEKEFVKNLNSILKNSSQQHWSNEGTLVIDSLFTINKAGLLSSTVKYVTDSGYYKVRIEVPVNKIHDIFLDIYLGLECEMYSVQVFQTKFNSDKFEFLESRELFHIGLLRDRDGLEEQLQLQGSLKKLLRYFSKL